MINADSRKFARKDTPGTNTQSAPREAKGARAPVNTGFWVHGIAERAIPSIASSLCYGSVYLTLSPKLSTRRNERPKHGRVHVIHHLWEFLASVPANTLPRNFSPREFSPCMKTVTVRVHCWAPMWQNLVTSVGSSPRRLVWRPGNMCHRVEEHALLLREGFDAQKFGIWPAV
jgi:hypothetical protein